MARITEEELDGTPDRSLREEKTYSFGVKRIYFTQVLPVLELLFCKEVEEIVHILSKVLFDCLDCFVQTLQILGCFGLSEFEFQLVQVGNVG